jgi:hypothetical protein
MTRQGSWDPRRDGVAHKGSIRTFINFILSMFANSRVGQGSCGQITHGEYLLDKVCDLDLDILEPSSCLTPRAFDLHICHEREDKCQSRKGRK